MGTLFVHGFDAQPVKDRFVILSDTESLIVGFGL